jgi:hypothetical protein
MTNYFPNIHNLQELKNHYKTLAKQYHPDLSGYDSTAIMQAINNQYEQLARVLANADNSKTDAGKQQEYNIAMDIMLVINKIIHLQNINIEVIGQWIWITGMTYQYKTLLKENKFQWSKLKSAWYYHNEAYHKLSNKVFSLDDIRLMYNSVNIQSENIDMIAQG